MTQTEILPEDKSGLAGGPFGRELVMFHVQTNPGSNPGPLMKVASGGELARFLLALKVVLAEKTTAPVLVFDEIDTGVGGATASGNWGASCPVGAPGAGLGRDALAAGCGARRCPLPALQDRARRRRTLSPSKPAPRRLTAAEGARRSPACSRGERLRRRRGLRLPASSERGMRSSDPPGCKPKKPRRLRKA